jgi:hypothetical protein
LQGHGCVTPDEALAFVREHGVVLESATGPVPSLASAIVGEPIRGSWWTHPRSREVFALTRAVRDAPDVLVCRLVDGKITYVHRRLWPALVRASGRFRRERLARVSERHTVSGRHVTEAVAFPRWVPAEISSKALRLEEKVAFDKLGAWCAQRDAIA